MFLLLNNQQPRSFEILNKEAYPGDTVVVRIEPQWQGPMVCLAAFGQHHRPNSDGYVFIGVPLSAKPDKEQVFLVECGRGVRLDSYIDEIIVLEKDFPKTRKSRGGGCSGTRTGPQAAVITYTYNLKNRSIPDLTESKDFTDPMSIPRDVIDPYGYIYSQTPKCSHTGVDLRMAVGTQVRVVNKGVVALVAKRFRAEGNMIIINHGTGIFSVYMHLSKIYVKEGEVVEKSDIIGLSGRTGAGVREPHLHLNIRIHDSYVDPLKFMDTVNKYLK